MKYCRVDTHFIDYLKKIDSRIPNHNYGGRYKPFLVGLFTIGDLTYVTQLTSPKDRHLTMKESIDFKKIYDKRNRLIACVNLNYMFPVKSSDVLILNINDIANIRTDLTQEENMKYARFLAYELRQVNKKNLPTEANNLYLRKYQLPDDTISKRCVDFKYLEHCAKCYYYAKEQCINIGDDFIELVKSNESFEDFKKNYIQQSNK